MNWKIVLAWMLALGLSTALVWQIVNVADSRVGTEPIAVAPPTTTTTGPSPTSTFPAPTTTRSGEATTSTVSGSTSGTNTSPPASSVTTTSPPSSPPSTEWKIRTINTSAGTVVVRHRPTVVELQAATPAPGFEVEIDDSGPDRVRVEFGGDDNEIRVEVEWEGDSLQVDIDES